MPFRGTRGVSGRPLASVSREELLGLIAKHGGNVRGIAFEAGIAASSTYHRLYALGLEPDVARARRAAKEVPEWLRRTRAALSEAFDGRLDCGDRGDDG